MRLSYKGLIAVGFVFFLGSCAGGKLAKIESSDNAALPQEAAGELQDKFAVKETLDIPPPPPPRSTKTSKTSAVASTKKKGKGKKQPPPEPEPELISQDDASAPSGQEFVWPNRRPAVDPLWVGEQLVYDISYFGVSAGEFTIALEGIKAVNNRRVYYARGTAVSSAVFSVFYRLNDVVESFFDYDGIFSHRFHIVLDESKQTRDSLELNDSEKAQTYYWNRWNHHSRGYIEVKEYKPIPRFPQDSMSAMYYIRTVLPIADGQMITFPVVSEGKNWDAEVTAMRREEFNSPALGKVRTIVLKPETKYQGILQKRGDSFLWFTDDEHRYMVKMEAKVKIGTVHATLKKVIPGTRP